MTPKGHGVIRDCDGLLYDSKNHGDFCGAFDLVYEPIRSGGHSGGHSDLLYDPKITVTFVDSLTKFLTPKGQGVSWGSLDLHYDLKGHSDLFGRFDLVYDPQNVMGSLEVAVTYLMTPKVNLTFDLDLDLSYDPKKPRGHKRSRWPTLTPKVNLTLTLT